MKDSTNCKANLKMLMKKPYLDRTINPYDYSADAIAKSVQQYTNKSFTATSTNKKMFLQPEMKRQSSQELMLARVSTPKCKFETLNNSQRSISPQKLYQLPDSLSKIYQQIHNKINVAKRPKQKTEEAKPQRGLDAILKEFINLEECVFSLLAIISIKKKVIKLCQKYLRLMPQSYFDIQVHQKLITKSIILERVSILVILYWAVGDDEDVQNIKNLLLYVHSGMIINLELLHNSPQITQNGKVLLENRLNKAKTNRKFKILDINQLRKNNNVVHSLLILLIENSQEFKYNKLETLLSNIDTMPINKGTQQIQQQFLKIENQKETLDTEADDLEYAMPILGKTEKYTLIIDLDETLVHYQEVNHYMNKLVDDGQFLVRPFAETFLIEMSKYYEIVIFTAALQDYADFILDLIDKEHVISHRLYRQHTTLHEGTHVKDIQKIGRNLKTSIIIDNLAENFSFQPDNGIQIQSWYGEPEDRALYQLAPLLIQIVKKQYRDVRLALRQFRDQMLNNIEQGIEDPHLHLSLQ